MVASENCDSPKASCVVIIFPMLTGRELDEHVRAVSEELARSLKLAVAQTESSDTFCGIGDCPIGAVLQSALDRLSESECWGNTNQIPSSLLWQKNESLDLLRRGRLQLQARTKPLGYAGDYQLLDRICRDDVTPWSVDPVGHAMDRFFQAQAAPQAVRNRYQLIAANIVEKAKSLSNNQQLRIASIGSGPAWDISWAIREDPNLADSLTATLVDIDPNSLAFCEARLRGQFKNTTQLKTIQANLGRLPRLKRVLSEIEDSDLIYCAGYFDYLDDDEAIQMLRTLWKCVAPGGELLIFNFNVDNPSRAYMEWVGNWYLTYRTSECMQQLAEAAALDAANIEIGTEPAGVNLFLRCRKSKG